MKKLVSIIIPVYNVENYVAECLESISAQTYDNLEIIVIDNGSQDKSGILCDEWAQKDNRIIVKHFRNKGLSMARNEGLALAKGEYIAFVDSDDFIHPRTYEFLVDAIENENADLAICHELAFPDGIEVTKGYYDKWTMQKVENQQQFVEHFMDTFTGPVSWVWNKLFTRELINNSRFINKCIEDMMFIADLSVKVKKVVWIKEKLYYYRQREGSICGAGKKDITLYYAKALIYCLEKFKRTQSLYFLSEYIGFLLNKLAICWAVAKKRKYRVSEIALRELYIQFYDQYNKKVTNCKIKYQIALARYFPLIYYMLKNPKSV